MPRQQNLTARTASGEPPSSARMHGRWRSAARVGWGALVVFTLTVVVASFPGYFAHLDTPCAGTPCSPQRLTFAQAEVLTGVGWSLNAYAAFQIALILASVLFSVVVSTVIVWRRPDDRMALLVALMLVALSPINLTLSVAVLPSRLSVPTEGLSFFGLVLTVLVFLLFPTGRFVPSFTRWTLAVFLPALLPAIFFPTLAHTPVGSLAYFPLLVEVGYSVLLVEISLLTVAQLYRYRRVSSPLERQQTKWVVVGLALPAAVDIGGPTLALPFPALADPTAPYGAPYHLALACVAPCLNLLLPLSFGVAILRYRLWEIDTLINKALVYGLLTGLLGALYTGLIIGLESLAGLVTGQEDQSAVIVVSTLVIAALFQPVRRRLQALIDRSFYRKKYDAEKTLAAFSATLRHQVDLEQIRAQVLVAVNETMQPASLSLWIFRVKPQVAEEGTRGEARFPAEAWPGAERLDAG
jgi:hypothetical protein